ncbi:3-isopropylmalate dehydratase, small subunit [Schinkia azotoformans MEV2011]|uniref:3-isopropylmalate dehydratase small subunit n=1 Tax=Schinkia azotoformans MEV2011 TaxID=1348973 RepID=A0A072NIJ8_SCHAZ|nr:3-isopropylmalate dehydratase small subunit [Schinkia azotoformans]KEF37524.1 3-isopropylmalate dehydratase, small subunit [Schinkia azotoformans MEV2011]MEC1697847.1 3-isopropylmalate dehydratase small subunit [Schinkia azotoformans]MEC1716002.1 3-isopropylmalate dehydratase small subunit [Schinkia azotoformans]MEC1726261.1 3-isopropylmalate dehydratase small subunit [Schinkia azotoformans]MEC1740045.1 3-isopropylmalate dehydratase small subunit [Schinkia azotoformans]
MIFTGTSHVYGNDIDTDRIIPGKYTKTLNMQELADHVFEDLDPDFRSKLVPGDILVAGTNFGCGSSREQAPLALKNAGVSVVIARSFARIFFRNAINIGLPILEIKDHTINDKDKLEVNLSTGEVKNLTTDETHKGTEMPSVMIDIINDGGLVQYFKKRGTYQLS